MQIRLKLKQVAGHLVFQVVCLLGISLVSNYRVPSLKDTSWDSALFLTPIGMLKNLMDKNPVMRSFYSDLSSGQTALANWQSALIALILTIQILNFLKLAKAVNK